MNWGFHWYIKASIQTSSPKSDRRLEPLLGLLFRGHHEVKAWICSASYVSTGTTGVVMMMSESLWPQWTCYLVAAQSRTTCCDATEIRSGKTGSEIIALCQHSHSWVFTPDLFFNRYMKQENMEAPCRHGHWESSKCIRGSSSDKVMLKCSAQWNSICIDLLVLPGTRVQS